MPRIIVVNGFRIRVYKYARKFAQWPPLPHQAPAEDEIELAIGRSMQESFMNGVALMLTTHCTTPLCRALAHKKSSATVPQCNARMYNGMSHVCFVGQDLHEDDEETNQIHKAIAASLQDNSLEEEDQETNEVRQAIAASLQDKGSREDQDICQAIAASLQSMHSVDVHASSSEEN